MIIYVIIILRNVLCTNSDAAKQSDTTDFDLEKQFLADAEAFRIAPPIDHANKDLHIILTNRYRDCCDEASLGLAYAKRLVDVYLQGVKSLVEECFPETIKKQKEIVRRQNHGNLTNQKTIYESLLSIFIDIFIRKYLDNLKPQNILNEEELKMYKESFSLQKDALLLDPDDFYLLKLTKTPLLTKKQKNEKIDANMIDKTFRAILIKKVFILIVKCFKNLSLNFSELSVYDIEKNTETLKNEIDKNAFINNIKKVYKKNKSKVPPYYCVSSRSSSYLNIFGTSMKNVYDLHTPEIVSNYFCDEFPDDFHINNFTMSFNYSNIHALYPHKMDISGEVFPKSMKDCFILAYNAYSRKVKPKKVYLTIFLEIEIWLDIFIDQILSELEDKYLDIIFGKNFHIDTDKRSRQIKGFFENKLHLKPFSDDIKSFLEILKKQLRLPTRIFIYIYKPKDAVFEGFRNKPLEGLGAKEVASLRILKRRSLEENKKSVMHCFKHCFTSALTEYLETDGRIIKKKYIEFEELS
ncbi:hypothetical protein CWI37_0610p0010 [Hamiltosporidium tvaerminnensis]|uniref:Uncharacterized protein n=1 Tax=Hamiltosporidium tvaerminnensis TaxID=1176355 RepID=A0A4Q9L322_9MICR|nr:hypothetical protein LUQ84_002081 [Hamiltosporidium tvaerminnensis]TBU01869.1 hypothetical protein CWI37_0610p0010 [Hamiltosporidium tvaerminnensis]